MKKSIHYMSDLAALFLAIYATELDRDDCKVYLSRNFKSIIKSITSLENFSKYLKKYNLLDDNGEFDINKFMNDVKISSVKKFWRDDFVYDFEKDCLVTQIEDEKAEKEIEKYDEDSVNFVKLMVDYYILSDEYIEYIVDIESKILDYIKY